MTKAPSKHLLTELEALLLEKKTELQHQLSLKEEGSKPVSLDEPIGRLSRMDAMQQQQMAKANRDAHRVTLARVNAALRRLEEKTFGECVECGEYIPEPRLRARPEAPFCVNCQTSKEH